MRRPGKGIGSPPEPGGSARRSEAQSRAPGRQSPPPRAAKDRDQRRRTPAATRFLAAGFILPWLLTSAPAQTLFDAALNRLPAQQGWDYAAFPGQTVQTLGADAVRLDTWSATVEQAGYGCTAPIPLDRRTGFTLLLTARVERESHGNPDRAGFSVIVLGHDRRGIELGFWPNAVFAQADLPLFTHAEDVSFDSATAFIDYALTIEGERYQLRANGTPILDGPLRDYTAFSGFLDPYETPDFIFLGDDTTSARAVVAIRRVVLVPAPVLQTTRDGVVTWTGVTNVAYPVLTSPDLVTWTPSASVTSATDLFAITNAPAAGAVFLRVAGP